MSRRGRKGFSLTEMVVVMCILLILYSMTLIYITVLTRTKAKIHGIVGRRDATHEAFIRHSFGGH